MSLVEDLVTKLGTLVIFDLAIGASANKAFVNCDSLEPLVNFACLSLAAVANLLANEPSLAFELF